MNLIKKIKSYNWKRWIKRPFNPFINSLFVDGITKKIHKKMGMPNVEIKAELYQNGMWYNDDKLMNESADLFEVSLKKKNIFDITNHLVKFRKKSLERIKFLNKQEKDLTKHLVGLYDLLSKCVVFLWDAHVLEVLYKRRIDREVPKYVKNDIDKFIGDASFPKKKNSFVKMEEMMRKGINPREIVKKYGWIRIRDGFSEPFSLVDIKEHMKELGKLKKHVKVKIPKELRQLFEEVQELVFFRTERTDIFYELLFNVRPFLKKIAKLYKIPFSQLKFYTIQSLIEGKPKKYNLDHTFACYQGNYYFSNKHLIKEEKIVQKDFVKGMVAYKGKVRGKAKIVYFVSEINKVKKGDIFITQITIPSYIAAMNRASAFVTDEGGLTCHAAIMAREMKKPCVIGTKIATKIFKDNDLVEVDAYKGVVRKIR